jgi:DNA-binding LacI/PurR family transcriptional regulator
MPGARDLKPVCAQPGRPLYLLARDALRGAIDAGIFHPDEQLPSTKCLSDKLNVSLVTAHRALQELVNSGVLQRAQGRGTFIDQRYLGRNKTCCDVRVGLAFHPDVSLADFYHGQILEGVRQAAQSSQVDLMLLRFGDAVRSQCSGYIYVNPTPAELEALHSASKDRDPALVVGARSDIKSLCHIDVDNVDLAKQAVGHLVSLGHRRIAYVGGSDDATHTQDRWIGFEQACRDARLTSKAHVIRMPGVRIEEAHLEALGRMFEGPERPTAIFVGGSYFALQIYGALHQRGLRIPRDVSVIAVDDPPAAEHLWPPLTTMRQPLFELGQLAMTALFNRISRASETLHTLQLPATLVIRESTAPHRAVGRMAGTMAGARKSAGVAARP